MSNQLTIKETPISIGDTVSISYIFKESGKEKKQLFEGIVMSFSGHGKNKSLLIRKVTKSKIGVERIFPVESPFIESIKVQKKATIRRAKLYFIRDKSNREIRERLYS